MKKRDLLLAGLFLCTIPAFGQPGVDEPIRYQDDAKRIFIQNFETANPALFNMENGIRLNPDDNRPTTLYTWDANPVDRIEQVTYYKRSGNSNPSGGTNIYTDKSGDYEVAGIRDTLMLLYDGVVKTDAKQPEDSILSYDKFSIERHTTETQQGTKGLDRFGENGGRQYFSYTSAEGDGIQNVGSSDYSTDNKAVAAYRRNLFVRNIPIEASSSYRVTVFVRPTQMAKTDKATLRFGLDLLRGYFHSEKPFIADLKGREEKQWWGGTSTVYDSFEGKSDYTDLEEGTWNKVTLMSYYNNDSIGNASAYLLSYYWAGDWDWRVARNDKNEVVSDLGRGKARNAAGELVNETDPSKIKDTATLTFIQQPDKYFVRIAFRSDSTQFDVDNLSLTKSWIGGVEHHNDLLRVDFGYQTNMGALAQAALEQNKIAAVELPGEYFDVWARFTDEQKHEKYWAEMPINSAEYHGDGYMYMWTKPYEEDGSMRSFEGTDSVLVTFRNPIDRPDLKLYYTGNTYPNGQDPQWRDDKTKRVVFDFHNEISSLNPNIDYSGGKKVLSLKDLPPVLQRQPYVEGTFGLDPNMREMTFKFSRQVYFQNTGNESTNGAFIKVVGKNATEYWEFKKYADAADTNTVIVRPAKYTTPLAGDYTITIDQITHLDDADLTDADSYSADVIMHLHFGDFEVNPASPEVAKSDWRSEITETGDWDRPCPPSLWAYSADDGFFQGTGENMDPYKKVGLYKMKDDGTNGNALFYLAGRQDGKIGNLYTVKNLAAGDYEISFPGFGWARNITTTMYIYPKPATMDYETLNGATKTAFGTFTPTKNTSWSGNAAETAWPSQTEQYSLSFNVPAAGDYVIEWAIPREGSQSYYGVGFGNYSIKKKGNLSLAPVRSIIEGVEALTAQITKADAAPKYKGSAYENLKTVKADAQAFVPAKKASGVNVPSEYAAEAELITKAVNAQKSRVDLIDNFFKTLDDAQAKVDIYKTADSLAAYKNLPDVQALQDLKDSYANFDYASKNDAAVNAENNKVQAAIRGIDNRVVLAQVYPDAIIYAKAMKDTAIAKGLDHAALDAAIVAAEAYDEGAATFAQLKPYMVALTDLAFATVYQDTLQVLSTRRIKELDAIAQSLGATYPEGVAAKIAAVTTDDDEVADIIKCAIKIAIYDKIVKGESVENIDLTPFIKNYFLYATVKGILDNSTLQLPGSRNEAAAQALQGAAQIQKIGHEWGQEALGKKCWVMILNQEYTDLFPGWSAESFVTGNHSMVTPDEGYGNLSKDTLANQGMVLNGKLAMDWNSKAELKQSISGLPAGIYTLGANIGGSGINSANLTITSDVQTYTKDIKTDMKSDNFMVLEQAIDIDYVIESGSGSPSTDDFSLTYVGKNDDPLFQQFWQQLLDNAKSELDNLVTIVDKAKAAVAGVEYYTISGIKLDAPKAGEILIRKTTQSNGMVVVDKVLIK